MKAFILHLYVSRKKANAEPFYHHFTTAVDTRNIQVFHTFLNILKHFPNNNNNDFPVRFYVGEGDDPPAKLGQAHAAVKKKNIVYQSELFCVKYCIAAARNRQILTYDDHILEWKYISRALFLPL